MTDFYGGPETHVRKDINTMSDLDDCLDRNPAADGVRKRMEAQRRAHADAAARWTETAPDDNELVWAVIAEELDPTRTAPSDHLAARLAHGPAPAHFARDLLLHLLALITDYGDNPIDMPAMITTARRLAVGAAADNVFDDALDDVAGEEP